MNTDRTKIEEQEISSALNISYVIRCFCAWVWRKKIWLQGYDVCYKSPKHEKSSTAFCKRRRGHFGEHRTGSGFAWRQEK